MYKMLLVVAFVALSSAMNTQRLIQRTHNINAVPVAQTNYISGGHSNVLGARLGGISGGISGVVSGNLRHPTYPYNQVDASGRLLGRSGIAGVLTQRGGGLHHTSVNPTSRLVGSGSSFQSSSSFQSGSGSLGLAGGANLVGANTGLVGTGSFSTRNIVPSTQTTKTFTQEFTSTGSGSGSFGAIGGGATVIPSRTVLPATQVVTTGQQLVGSGLTTGASQLVTDVQQIVGGGALVTGASSGQFTSNVVSPPQVVNEPPEVIHEKPTIIAGTVQNEEPVNNVQESNMRTEENRQVNRNREINTYTVQRNRVNKVIQNLQKQTHHKHINTNVNTNVRRVHNPHVEREIITHVKNQVQPVELIYNKVTNTESVQEVTNPTQSQSERTVQHPTVTLPLQSSVVADDVQSVPGQRSEPIVHPVRQVASVNQGQSGSTLVTGGQQVVTTGVVQPSVSTTLVQPASVLVPSGGNLGFGGTVTRTSEQTVTTSGSGSGFTGGAQFGGSTSGATLVGSGQFGGSTSGFTGVVPAVSTGTTTLGGSNLVGGSSFERSVTTSGSGSFSSGAVGGVVPGSLEHRSGFNVVPTTNVRRVVTKTHTGPASYTGPQHSSNIL